MDDLAFKRTKKITAAMVKAGHAGDEILRREKKKEAERMGKGRVFDSYDEARAWIIRIFTEYNDRPHRSLKKMTDPATGRVRHQTPREALNEHRANGWEPVALTEAELIDAFRPHVVVKVTRETVTPYGGMRYKNPEVLGHWNRKEVIVAYDLDDYKSVWVKDMKGALICVAEFVEATGYRAQSARDAGNEKRAKAQIRNKERGIETIKARNPDAALEGEFERVETFLDFIDIPAVKVKPEPEKTILDFLPERKEKEKETTYADTVLWLYGDKKKDETEEELAASS